MALCRASLRPCPGCGTVSTHGFCFCVWQLERMKKEFDAVRRGEVYVHEDHADKKLDASNKGFALLQKAGWTEGSALGAAGTGRTAPVSATAAGGAVPVGAGVGVAPVSCPAPPSLALALLMGSLFCVSPVGLCCQILCDIVSCVFLAHF